MPKKLLLVDAPNHAFRAYHAIQQDMRAPDGFPTRALYGFTRILLTLVRDQKPDYVALVFDVGNSFRNELYPAYKGQRPDMPEDLRQQWGEFGPLAEEFGFAVIAIPNTEADDVIGTLAVRFASEDVHVGIVSGDKDFCQLVNDRIHIVDLVKGKDIGPAEVVERWGVPAERIIDLLSLMGDTVDNVPGVPGVGEKKAAQYLVKYGDMEGVLANAAAIGGKTGEAITANTEAVRLARLLVTIETAIPVDVTLDGLALRPRDDRAIARRLTRYNFRTLMNELKLDPAALAEASSVRPASQDAAPVTGGAPVERTATEAALVWGPAAFADLDRRLRAAGRCVLHVEASPSTDPLQDPPRPMALWLAWSEGGRTALATVPWGAAAARGLGPVLGDATVKKAGFDLKRAWKLLVERAHPGCGVTVDGIDGDALLADYLCAPEQKRSFDEVCRRWLERTAGPGPEERILAVVALLDRLDAQVASIQADRVYHAVDLPILPVLAGMELEGIGVEVPALTALSVELEGRLATMVTQIHAAAGETFNINSTQQLATILFEKLQLKGAKKTKTGWSTDADTLDKLRDQHPLPGLILSYRELFKLKGTYVDALPRTVAPDGRIHTTFDQTVAATGRLSSNDPNLQNIPVRSEEGRRIRRCFVARPGHQFVSADYSQIELRVLAHYCAGGVGGLPVDPSGGGALVESFRHDEDIHRRTASEIFGVAQALVSSEQRRAAKAINFGIVYGMGASRLANDLRIARAEAQAYIDGYFARYPQVRAYMEGACARARETGYAETLYGRRRPVSGLDAGNPMDRATAERVAINTPIQGTAADLIKLAMVRVAAAIRGTGARLLLQVHDELVLEVPDAEVEAVRVLVRGAMESVAGLPGAEPVAGGQSVTLCVPLKVDTGVARTWDGAH